jgi:NAD(P)-dependent dehydrogenase (short-subunit alcohol dehydrogenase family)
VNAVAPQLLDTPANRATFPEDAMAHAVVPEAIAGLIAFLVSDAAAPVSGAILPADGAQAGPGVHTAPAGPRPVPGWPAPARGASR